MFCILALLARYSLSVTWITHYHAIKLSYYMSYFLIFNLFFLATTKCSYHVSLFLLNMIESFSIVHLSYYCPQMKRNRWQYSILNSTLVLLLFIDEKEQMVVHPKILRYFSLIHSNWKFSKSSYNCQVLKFWVPNGFLRVLNIFLPSKSQLKESQIMILQNKSEYYLS